MCPGIVGGVVQLIQNYLGFGLSLTRNSSNRSVTGEAGVSYGTGVCVSVSECVCECE